jgi:prevent-host-death family protein
MEDLEMRSVGAFEAKTHLSELLREVEEKGNTITIERRGKPVAVLSSVVPVGGGKVGAVGSGTEDALAFFRELRGRTRATGAEIAAWRAEGHRG